MDFKLLYKSLQEAWHNSPVVMVLVILGILVFLFLIIDAHKRRKSRRSRIRK
ncbi:hypothetical protein Cflav_PD1724 [Pedosphaera parvula Ellin514]|uniref:Uncharacterized protein n=1 Tax=Pedosphaera parvula (strain Ellin514) TaxID=320771 RepID=B9XNJ4_PEDPL|nr:hypothetical protein Cflav_PD1724 [Pedosphaera parvula Ellin514]